MLSVELVAQSPDHCGPACLQMVLGYYGITSTPQDLAKKLKTRPKIGTPAQNLVRVAKDYGFHAQLLENQEWNDLMEWVTKKKVPVIVNWFSVYDTHYSVVVKITPTHIWLADPEHPDIRKYPRGRFYSVWFGKGKDTLHFTSGDDLRIRRMIAIHPLSSNRFLSRGKKHPLFRSDGRKE